MSSELDSVSIFGDHSLSDSELLLLSGRFESGKLDKSDEDDDDEELERIFLTFCNFLFFSGNLDSSWEDSLFDDLCFNFFLLGEILLDSPSSFDEFESLWDDLKTNRRFLLGDRIASSDDSSLGNFSNCTIHFFGVNILSNSSSTFNSTVFLPKKK